MPVPLTDVPDFAPETSGSRPMFSDYSERRDAFTDFLARHEWATTAAAMTGSCGA